MDSYEIDLMVEDARSREWEDINAGEDEPEEDSEMLDTLDSVYEQLNDAFIELWKASRDIEEKGEHDRMMECLTMISNAMSAIYLEEEKRKAS